MRSTRVWARALALGNDAIVESVSVDDDGPECEVIVVACRAKRRFGRRCGQCGKRSAGYDQGEGRRRWRGLDAGVTKVFIEADAPRLRCREHGVTVAAVRWARHGAGHTRAFDDQVAWLVTHTSKTAVMALMGVAWRTVVAIAARVVADDRRARDPFDGLVRIGIDEISYRRGHKYLLKEHLRLVFRYRGDEAVAMLDAWLSWARRSQVPAFVALYHRIKKHRAGIIASVTHGLSNGLTESVNTKLRLLTRLAYGFKSTDNMIALCLLDRGGHCPPLPGR